MSRRRCFALDLVDDADLIAAYEAHHAPGAVWRPVVDHLRASGIEAMEIWRVDDRLVMVVEAAEDYPRPVPPPADVERWEASMDRFQKRLTIAAEGEKWVEMRRIFTLDGE